MNAKVKEAKRMELICDFIKTGKQPDGFMITETKTGKYRLTRNKNDKESLEAKRKCYQKKLEDINEELKKFEQEEPSSGTQDLGPNGPETQE